MQFAHDIRRVLGGGPGLPLDADEAQRLWGAILDESMDDVELGAVVAGIAARGETQEEMLGLHRAVTERLASWTPPLEARAIALPAYGAVEGEARLTALAASLLRHFGIPVVIHGTLDSPRGMSAARVLREIGILPCSTLAQADHEIVERRAAFVPVQLLAPSFAALLALRGRLGIENSAHRVAQALDPTRADAIRLGFCVGPESRGRLVGLAAAAGGQHLALEWPRDDLSRHLTVRPCIEHVHGGRVTRLFEADPVDTRNVLAELDADASGIGRWIGSVTSGEVTLPAPVVNLVAACLHAVGDACDLSRAKALAALHAARLAA